MGRFLVRVPGVALLFGTLSLTALAALEAPDALGPALSGDADAIAALRGEGPAGLDRVLDAHAQQATPQDEAAWRALIDAVAGQRDAVYSGLYWHTDLEAAKAAAAESGRPILSLRLLGALTDEYSCANSRFFRAALYSNPDLARLIEDRYVLHWSTERAVPVVTVDFGDGRLLRRTLTGNSVHYILDEDGRPIDALPGMFSPGVFSERLLAADALHADLRDLPGAERDAFLAGWHAGELDSAAARLSEALAAAGRPVDSSEMRSWLSGGQIGGDGPEVRRAMNLSMSKMFVETPLLEEVVPGLDGLNRGAIEPTDAEWDRIAADFAFSLHPTSRQLIADQQPLAFAALDSADPAFIYARFEQNIAEDTARNELSLHAQIHGWFADGSVTDFTALNRRVYDELFATPADDPWMGLVETDVYTGLSGGGIILSE